MENKTLSENSSEKGESSLSRDERAKLFNYPSIDELFNEGDSLRLGNFYEKLRATGESLERIIRNGSREEAASAERANNAVKVTLEFLKSLEKMRQ